VALSAETPVHETGEDLHNDHNWLNQLARYRDAADRDRNGAKSLEDDRELIAKVNDHLDRCIVCRNVITTGVPETSEES
jgi:hypothetical protein